MLAAALILIAGATSTFASDDRCELGGVLEPLEDVRGKMKPAPPNSLKHGLVIQSVDEDGFFARNGLRAGDIIGQIRAKSIESKEEFSRWYETAPIEKKERLIYWRVPSGMPGYRRLVLDASFSPRVPDAGTSAYDGLDAGPKRTFIDNWETAIDNKKAEIASIEDRLVQLELNPRPKASKSKTKRSASVADRATLESSLYKSRQELRELRHNIPPLVPRLTEMKTGEAGWLSPVAVVFQKLSGRRALVHFNLGNGVGDLLLLDDWEIKLVTRSDGTIAEDRFGYGIVKMPRAIIVSGTYKYLNRQGDERVVPVIRELKWIGQPRSN